MDDQNIRLDFFAIDDDKPASVAMFEAKVQAGFPSPAQGMPGDTIDLNKALISNAAATFCARVTGNSMVDAGINDGDLLIIDRSLDPDDGDIAVCFIDGDFTVKRIAIKSDGVYLVPANAKFPEIHVLPENHFQIWGVVSHVIKHMGKHR